MHTAPGQPVLVTGATGFIGAHLVRRLIERRIRVFCLVRPTSRTDDLRAAGAHLLPGDVTDAQSIHRALAESQAVTVYHLAGLVRARRQIDFSHVNAAGAKHIAAACAARPQPPVLILVSSLAAAGPSTTTQPRIESDAPAPISNYGRSKLAGELAAAQHAATVPTTIIRPPIVFGPGDRAVLEIFRPIVRLGIHLIPAPRSPTSNPRLSLIHVDDLVNALLLAAEKGERIHPSGSPGRGIYFISASTSPDANNFPTYTQLGHAIATSLGRKPPTIIRVPTSLLKLIGRAGDALTLLLRRPTWLNTDKVTEALAESWTCSSAKARTQLAWSPAAPLADRLHETAAWYRQARWL